LIGLVDFNRHPLDCRHVATHGHAMTRDLAQPLSDKNTAAQIDAALSALIRLIAGQVAREMAEIALPEETSTHGPEIQN
jgi:hypothetical protein